MEVAIRGIHEFRIDKQRMRIVTRSRFVRGESRIFFIFPGQLAPELPPGAKYKL